MATAVYPRQNSSGFLIIILLACVLLATVAGVIMGSHAIERHGNDAQAVRQSVCHNGIFMSFIERDKCTKHNLTRISDNCVGDMITTVNEYDAMTYEVSSFIPKGGILGNIIKWLDGKGATRCK